MLTNNQLLLKYLDFFELMQKKWKVTDDCMQICYLAFLEYDNEKLNELDTNNQMEFWIVRLIKNQWFSKTSTYYAQYGRYYEKIESIED